MNLSTRQLRVFLHVAHIGNFTRAAEQAHMTQAGLSIMMREMEKQLGCRLFDRTTRMVVLTQAGRQLLPVVQRMMAELDTVAAHLGEAGDRARHTLRIAATPLVSYNILPQVFTAFGQSHPHVTLSLTDTDLAQVQQHVVNGDADLGLGFFFKQVSGIERTPLGSFRLMRVSAAGTAAQRTTGTAPWASLKHEPLIGLPPLNPIQQLVEQQLARIGRANEARPSFNFFDTLVSMVEAGLGTAVMPSVALASCQRHRVRTALLTRPSVALDIYEIKRRGVQESDTAIDFRRALVEALPAA